VTDADVDRKRRLLAAVVGDDAANAMFDALRRRWERHGANALHAHADDLLSSHGVDPNAEPPAQLVAPAPVVADAPSPRDTAPSVPTPARTSQRSPRPASRASREGTPRAAFLSKRERQWLAEMRQQEGAMLTLSQRLIEPLVTTLPPLHFAAYAYLRALACNAERPGCAIISHAALGRKLRVSERTAKAATAALRAAGVIALARRGAKLYGTANAYRVPALTPAILTTAAEHYGVAGNELPSTEAARIEGNELHPVEGSELPSIALSFGEREKSLARREADVLAPSLLDTKANARGAAAVAAPRDASPAECDAHHVMPTHYTGLAGRSAALAGAGEPEATHA